MTRLISGLNVSVADKIEPSNGLVAKTAPNHNFGAVFYLAANRLADASLCVRRLFCFGPLSTIEIAPVSLEMSGGGLLALAWQVNSAASHP
ncbi:hypothetical protein [Sinorhizobium meliloti]|uniref:hypothetical protein n=1 Tax=Rhizobium meliloti TaxID=382 RepID=UPI001297CFAD|nr:hypothetical protein [Sinorhizobium meliloti]MQU69079.1 hypothetical protein [Sinorhizobium meliloti]